MDLAQTLSDFFRQFWGLWLMLLFIGIVIWAFRPGSRHTLEPHGSIPLRDDPDDTCFSEGDNGAH